MVDVFVNDDKTTPMWVEQNDIRDVNKLPTKILGIFSKSMSLPPHILLHMRQWSTKIAREYKNYPTDSK